MTTTTSKPWYREGWLWFVFTPPIIAVLAGFATLAQAIHSDDGLVDKAYYESGITINQQKTRLTAARTLAVSARLEVVGNSLRLLLNPGAAPIPGQLRLRAQFASRAQIDRSDLFTIIAPGVYQSTALPLGKGHWYLALEDSQRHWLLYAEAVLPSTAPISFVPEQEAAASL